MISEIYKVGGQARIQNGAIMYDGAMQMYPESFHVENKMILIRKEFEFGQIIV